MATPSNKRLLAILVAVLVAVCTLQAQPVYRFSVKVGIDCESVDSLGGLDRVKPMVADMFHKVNRAFNHGGQFAALYDFEVDWDAFYVYDGISTDEVYKPHPDHDYLVVIDGYKSNPAENGGGWYGADIQTVYHSRIHNDRFNNPFEQGAIDGIIHEFGHSRGMPDIYAMKVDADKNPVAPIACQTVRCIMDYPYGETHWSRYAVNMINAAADKRIEIDNLVAAMCPDKIDVSVNDADGNPVEGARLRLYPVGWYSYSVSPEPIQDVLTGSDGHFVFPGDVYGKSEEFGLGCPNVFVEAKKDGKAAYGWLPLYEVQNAAFDGLPAYRLQLRFKADAPNDPLKTSVPVCYPAPQKQAEPRWTIAPDGSIRWDVTESSYPHSDHIEMTGEQLSCVLRWGVDASGAFSEERSLVFPLLRTIPNDTHASLNIRTALDVPSLLAVDGLSLKNEKVETVSIDGAVGVSSTFCVGKHNIGSAKGAAPVPAVRVERTVAPSMNLPMLVEQYTVTNIRKTPLTLYVPEFTQAFNTPAEKGVDGSYVVLSSVVNPGTVRLEPGCSRSFGVVFQGCRASEAPVEILDGFVDEQLAARKGYVSQVTGNLVFECPDNILETMFRHAKVRVAESIIKTSGGYMHAPGGESYYAAIWANDQAEYANPFFPFLGYDVANESALNSYRHFARFMNDEWKPIPSSIIAEGKDIWDGAGDRGDAAMIAYGASRYCLEMGDKAVAEELWPLIEWCLEYCGRKVNSAGVVESDTDEMEGRFPSGNANLNTSSLYYDALNSACYLAKAIGKNPRDYAKRAKAMRKSIESYFGAEVSGYHTYRYYDGNDILRSWICTPLTMGVFDRADGTVQALFSPEMWTENGLLTAQGDKTFWDRPLLYAFRGIFAAGYADQALDKMHFYSERRLLGDHVPYAIEAWPEGSQRHLAAESGLYCRVVTEGLFGIRPTGLDSFDLKPSLPSSWPSMALRGIKAFGSDFGLEVRRVSEGMLAVDLTCGDTKKTYTIKEGSTLKIRLK